MHALSHGNSNNKLPSPSPLNIAVAGTGYVGLSIATLLAQHNHVTAVSFISSPKKICFLILIHNNVVRFSF